MRKAREDFDLVNTAHHFYKQTIDQFFNQWQVAIRQNRILNCIVFENAQNIPRLNAALNMDHHLT